MTQDNRGCAFITGSASGLGRGLAIELAGRGTPLALADLSAEGLEETRRLAIEAGAPLVSVHGGCDVARPEAVNAAAQAALNAHGTVRYVICNAGVGFVEPLSKTTLKDIEWIFGVNTFGVYNTIMAFLPTLKAQGTPATVLCTASMAAVLTPPGWHLGVYSASKFAVCALAQGLRDDLGEGPVTVSVAYPGVVDTNISANALSLRPTSGAPAPKLSEEEARAATENLPDEFKKPGMTPREAARIIIAGVDRGLTDIFTHPDEIFMHEAYSRQMTEGFRRSAELVAG
ncbi:SDR family NAD(P)-dependent oxidoreductase [Paracoccus yeei]|uniref:SDR family NAD(P)-dependent oxidoreductase n=1 Tax=Paracoccus yeei TaxID=147645 RepID=UPI002432D90C|nr:SDR family oxidoreductase [Paracoccus yeei]